MIEGTKEIYNGAAKEIGGKPFDQAKGDDQQMDDDKDDEGFETLSEEDISDDEPAATDDVEMK